MSSVPQNVIKHKVGLLNLAAELGNVSRACKVMGFSRDTFYRYQSAMEAGGVEALLDASRKKPNLRNRVEEATEAAVAAFALEQPAYGQVRVSNELRKRGIFISPSGVRSVWLRRNLESFKKRLTALERHVAQTGEVLTEAQVAALERKQDDDISHGEIETIPIATRPTPATTAPALMPQKTSNAQRTTVPPLLKSDSIDAVLTRSRLSISVVAANSLLNRTLISWDDWSTVSI